VISSKITITPKITELFITIVRYSPTGEICEKAAICDLNEVGSSGCRKASSKIL
jgi:hypothetical protein